MADLTEQIAESAAAPKRASNETGSMEAHSLKDLIEADRYLKSQSGADNTATRGLRRNKIVPFGPTS